jgi:uncharacterized membrane protein
VNAQGQERGFVWQRGQFTTVQVPGASDTRLVAINNRGQMAGSYDEAARNPDGKYPPGTYHGLIWDHGRLTRLDVPGSALTGALGINDAGAVSGGYADPSARQHGFLFRAGRFTTFDAPAPGNTNGFGIDNRGDVVVPDPASGTGLET